jgi:glycerophosphoryl diester phosphodiesterase
MFSLVNVLVWPLSGQEQPQSWPDGFEWQGHRGARGLMPENSLPSFLKAMEFRDVVTLELDLAVSKDKQLIVSHEPWFNPDICSPGPGAPDTAGKMHKGHVMLYALTAEEIRTWDCGAKGNPRFPEQEKHPVWKPTLRYVVNNIRLQYPDRMVRWNIEIKSQPDWDGVLTPPIADYVALVIAELRHLGLGSSITVQSFDVRALQEMHRQAPEYQLALLVENVNGVKKNVKKLGFTPPIYSPYYKLLSKKAVRRCHDMGMRVVPWTVNDVNDMRKLIRLGVDGIITDYPNLIEKVSQE